MKWREYVLPWSRDPTIEGIRFHGKEGLQIGRDMFFYSGVRCDKNILFVTLQVGRAGTYASWMDKIFISE